MQMRAWSMLMATVLSVAIGSKAYGVGDGVVTFELVVNDNGSYGQTATPNAWSVYATLTGNNVGLAGFGVALSGIATSSNKSPSGNYTDSTALHDPLKAGFSESRNVANASLISGAIDSTDSGGYMIMGFGRQSYDMSAPIPTG